MEFRVKPVIVLNRRENAFRHPDGTRKIIADEASLTSRVAQLSKALREGLKFGGLLLEDAIAQSEDDLQKLKTQSLRTDTLLVYLIGTIPVQGLTQWGLPIIAFSGQCTPTQALYAFGVDRQSQPDITIALDFQDIDDALQLLIARKKLRNTRAILFGFPSPLFSRWLHMPDMELARQRFGVTFEAVEIRDLLAQLPTINKDEAKTVAGKWLKEAKKTIEPSKSDVIDAARLYLALHKMLKEAKANALAINCLEMMNSLKAPPPCYAITRLRDEGIPAACEADVVSLLSMLLLGYVADKPAFMGNIVGAIPEDNIIRVSHDAVPTKMAGFGEPPNPYILRNYHWKAGVTAYVELQTGQEVTIARLARNLDKMLLLSGQLVECRETTACRTTMSLKVNDARKFIQSTFGNHHVVVYGNAKGQVKALAHALGIEIVEL